MSSSQRRISARYFSGFGTLLSWDAEILATGEERLSICESLPPDFHRVESRHESRLPHTRVLELVALIDGLDAGVLAAVQREWVIDDAGAMFLSATGSAFEQANPFPAAALQLLGRRGDLKTPGALQALDGFMAAWNEVVRSLPWPPSATFVDNENDNDPATCLTVAEPAPLATEVPRKIHGR